MRFHDNGSFFSVSVSPTEVREFAARWPCSGMRDARRGMWFQYDKRGNLVDIKGEASGYDPGAVAALSEDAQKWGARFTVCTNCGGNLPTGHGFHGRKTPHLRFCDYCAGIAEALGIGDPRNAHAFLYDNGQQRACAWTGPEMGTIVHKFSPDSRRGMRGAVRYRVRMLDGSLWYGSGPTDNGNYIRLRRMKGGA